MRFALVLALVACGKHDRADRPATAPPADPPKAQPAGAALADVPTDVVGKLALREVASGLERPVLVVAAPGAPHRLYIVEQRGRIRILEDGKLRPDPFFTISDLSDGNEEGLLGLAFHPKFAENGRIFLNYTSRDMATHIVEYRATADRVDPKSAREIIRIDQPYSNHNGGNLVFGPDGKLYTGMGDGGKANDPHGNGQNPKALLAKIVRFDVDAAEPKPEPNVEAGGLRPTAEIVHTGMRNPWRFSFDRDGTLYIGDVGQNLWEEVDVAPPGSHLNFGWNIMEGTHCFDAATGMTQESCDEKGLTLPVAEYPHSEGCSITGGPVYRGKALPALDGVYFYGDYCTGLLRSFRWQNGAIRDHWDWKAALDREGILQQVSSFGTDGDGELYIVELTGSIYELVAR